MSQISDKAIHDMVVWNAKQKADLNKPAFIEGKGKEEILLDVKSLIIKTIYTRIDSFVFVKLKDTSDKYKPSKVQLIKELNEIFTNIKLDFDVKTKTDKEENIIYEISWKVLK